MPYNTPTKYRQTPESSGNEGLIQVQDEITISLRAMQPLREIWRDRIIRYVDQNIDDEKLSVNTYYAMMNLHLATQYEDDMSVIVEPRKIGDEELADNLTDLANFDYSEMDMKRQKFQMKWDEANTGVSLRVREGQDEEKQVPISCIYDPLTWLPDPYGDHITGFRFHYFESQMLPEDMTKERGFDEEKVEALKNSKRSIEANMTLNATDRATAMQRGEDLTENGYIGVYDGYAYRGDELHHITVDTNLTEIIRDITIKPLKGEKKIPMCAFVNVSWFSPRRGSVCGVSLADLAIPKQKIESILMNLQVTNAKFGTFGQTNLVNTDIIKNTADLQRPTVNTRWIGVNAGNQSLSNAIYPVPRQALSNDAFAVTERIKQQMQLEA